MNDALENLADFGELPRHVDVLMQKAVALFGEDPDRARAMLRHVIEIAPETLPAYRSLVKLLNREQRFDDAIRVIEEGLVEASRQIGIGPQWMLWTRKTVSGVEPARPYLLQFLKALAFVEVRRGDLHAAGVVVEQLARLDPEDGVGHSVISALLLKLQEG